MSDQTTMINNKLANLTKAVEDIGLELVKMQQDINSRTRLADLATSEGRTNSQIYALNTNIQKLEERLSKVVIPDDTRYYLEMSEVENFRLNMSKLLAMMADFERLYNNLVAYTANNT